MIVELVGTPGAGKTTLATALITLLEERGIAAASIEAAARDHMRRTRLGRLIDRLAPVGPRPPAVAGLLPAGARGCRARRDGAPGACVPRVALAAAQGAPRAHAGTRPLLVRPPVRPVPLPGDDAGGGRGAGPRRRVRPACGPPVRLAVRRARRVARHRLRRPPAPAGPPRRGPGGMAGVRAAGARAGRLAARPAPDPGPAVARHRTRRAGRGGHHAPGAPPGLERAGDLHRQPGIGGGQRRARPGAGHVHDGPDARRCRRSTGGRRNDRHPRPRTCRARRGCRPPWPPATARRRSTCRTRASCSAATG